MKKSTKRWLIFISVVLIFLLGLTAYSHLRYNRSVSSTVVENILRFMKEPKTQKEAVADLKKEKADGEKKYKIDSSINFDVEIGKSKFEGLDTYTLNGEKNNGTVILYIHGGGYVEQPLKQHWEMLNRVAKNTKAKIVVPIYPKAPFVTYEKSYHLLTDMYKSIKADNDTRKIVMMGDSAGGGLALGLAETFEKEDILQPDALVLLSPWVDVTMENPETEKFDKIDPMLDRNTLIVNGKSWAGSTNTKDYRISPLFGDMSGLKNVTIFVGTREEFYSDIMKLDEKLLKANVKTTLHVGVGQNHVYPCIPVKEGREAIGTIEKLINNL